MSYLFNSKIEGERLKRPSLRTTSPQITSPTTLYSISNISENSEHASHNQDPWDELGSEGSEHALIWHIYNDESTKLDAATTDGLNRGIDVLLVFTGLFSAVLTTFSIQSYQQMLPSPSDSTNALLAQLITDLRSSSVLQLDNTPVTAPSNIIGQTFVPSTVQIHWVNGLWFAALACSLSAALVSMLAKQWIQTLPNVSGSPRYRARQRQRRHNQLKQWRVSAVISALPLLLHVALLLFFAGIIVLLWSGDAAIMGATFGIVALAYTFYLGSMWMSLIYPDCPYQHPISEHLRRFFVSNKPKPIVFTDLEAGSEEQLHAKRRPMIASSVDPDHLLDASSLVWLLEQCSNEDTIAATLQAIGGLPKEFTAFHILRDTGAIPLVLHYFTTCFYRDVSFDLKWHVSDAAKAERYCRAWVRLTHGTTITWPRSLQQPLNALKQSSNTHASAIASCTIALNSLEARMPHLSLIYYLKAFVADEVKLSDLTQSWLLDTFLECSLSWELRAAVINDVVQRSVPVLIRVLQRAKAISTSHSQITIPLILRTLILGKVTDRSIVWDEKERSQPLRQTMIPVLTSIIQRPDQYGIKGDLLDFVIIEFSQLVAPFFTHSNFPTDIKEAARKGLSKLYLEGQIVNGLIPDAAHADILQILHPPTSIPSDHRPRFAKVVLGTLATSSSLNVQIGCIRLVESLLRDCDSCIIRAFVEEQGMATLLRLSNIADTDSRRLQSDCIRTLCIFIQSSAPHLHRQAFCPSHSASIEKQFDEIFASDFFKVLLFAVGSRHWWLAEIAEVWLPSLLQLCRIRPQEQIWKRVEVVFRDFAENHIGEEGTQHMMNDLHEIRKCLPP